MVCNVIISFLFRLKKIENLDSLIKLDVLDLHGNQVTFLKLAFDPLKGEHKMYLLK